LLTEICFFEQCQIIANFNQQIITCADKRQPVSHLDSRKLRGVIISV